ncbi:hypothetical protein KL86SPO_20518 [uncultured Sporomusa sp.]|uniref:Uncharacterized protein n=1 Tax=uncultured Sporomusa sp. TaxID=307249 RepID=A0A212LP47_9FIRM|nr:hypothetical protein [uncultured Sporomusa sp.]SCM79335.1 hypothetical protein KL86SPO_20518 [uncultured Sporomusa sp.]
MCQQWQLLGDWLVNDQRRVIIKHGGPQLIDITADQDTIYEIISKVLNSSWSMEEFMRYLKEKDLAV